MKCPACASEIPADSKFCPKCGEAVDGTPPVSEARAAVERLKTPVDQASAEVDAEEQLWVGGYSGKAMVGSWIGAGVLTIGLLVAAAMLPMEPMLKWSLIGGVILFVWLYLGLTLAYRKLSVHYELTTQRFIHRTGILTRTTDRIEVIDMDDVTFQQGIVQRMFGIGRIQITSSDRSHPELVLRGIADVQRIAGLIDDVRRKERRRRGIHIEAI